VRMLGPGRPFIVEISNARVIPSSAEIRKLERDINSLKEGWVSLLSSFLELPMLSMISLSLLVS
jgi:tRNA U54 and U55 pseudouridine synthase Pus10